MLTLNQIDLGQKDNSLKDILFFEHPLDVSSASVFQLLYSLITTITSQKIIFKRELNLFYRSQSTVFLIC